MPMPDQPPDPLTAPIDGSERKTAGSVTRDIVRAGTGRICRTIYYPGFVWEKDMQPAVTAELCLHAHVGFLARGHLEAHFPDGCRRDWVAPAVVCLEPGHRGSVVGDEPAVLIEFDFEGETATRFGLPEVHRHD
jgi:hypothetical protein